ncbi:MAG: ABC transporter ATP-binding protein, partial [Candidatus Zixiibacteriota bacterium]
ALDGLTMTVPQGEVYGLLGPAGAGKSTLFRALFGIIKPNAGELYINGLQPSNPRSRGNIGFLPEKPQFPGHLTARQLLNLAGQLFGMKPSDIDERTGLLLEQFDLHRWPDLKIKSYSKGLIQKVGVAQAMITNPDVLILDEPFDGLDERSKADLTKAIDKIRSEAKAVVISSYHRSNVEALADRIGIIKKGKILRTINIAAIRDEKCMYEIEANIGHAVFEIPDSVGKKIRVSTNNMIVELVKPEYINAVIDEIRMKGVNITSIKPMNTKLEQSLYEEIAEPEDPKIDAETYVPQGKVTV